MRLDRVKLGVSPITDKVYLGTLAKNDPGCWAEKREATSDFCQCLLTWVPPGTIREISSSTGARYEIEVRLLPAKEA